MNDWLASWMANQSGWQLHGDVLQDEEVSQRERERDLFLVKNSSRLRSGRMYLLSTDAGRIISPVCRVDSSSSKMFKLSSELE